MVVKPAPAAALEMAQPQFLLELLVIAQGPPAQLGQPDQPYRQCVGRQVGQPVLGRLRLAFGPLDQQPQLGPGFRAIIVSVSRADPHGGEAGGQATLRSLAPADLLPCLRRQRVGERLDRDGLVLGLAAQAGRPRPDQGFGGNGPVPDGQTEVVGRMPAT